MQIKNILQFLNELKINNNREWFAENKGWYDKIRSEFEQISKDLIVEISKFDDEIKHVEVKDCVFRIYRDTRFSHDKTPYKTHFGVYIATQGGRKSQRAGYYLHIDPAGCFVGAGVWCPESNLLKALRQSVYDNIEELNAIRSEKNFAKYFPEAELLKLKHYLVEYKLNDLIEEEHFVQKVAEVLKHVHPFNQFLNYTVDEVMGY